MRQFQTFIHLPFFQKFFPGVSYSFKNLCVFFLFGILGFSGKVFGQTTSNYNIPPCEITGPEIVSPNSNNTYSGPSPIPSGYTYVWSVTGSGTIVGSNSGESVEVKAGPYCDDHFKLILKIKKNGYVKNSCYIYVKIKCEGDNVGCTHGFWKNATSFWDNINDPIANCAGGTTTSLFKDVFGITNQQMTNAGLPTDLTLLDALKLGGGGFAQLVRDAVAALLNTCAGINYEFSKSKVLNKVQKAFADGDSDPVRKQLNAANESGKCPLRSDGYDDEDITNARVVGKMTGALAIKPSVRAYPNPYKNMVSFSIASPVSGKATLEIYNMVGQKLAIVFAGNVKAGIQQTVRYNVPVGKGSIVYKLTVGSHTTQGMLLPLQ